MSLPGRGRTKRGLTLAVRESTCLDFLRIFQSCCHNTIFATRIDARENHSFEKKELTVRINIPSS